MNRKLSILLMFLSLIFAVTNCKSVNERYNTISNFGINEEYHRVGTRPLEVIADIGERNIEGTVQSTTTLWLFASGDGKNTNFLRRLASAPVAVLGTVAGIIPLIGDGIENASYMLATEIAGDQDLIELAKTRAINTAKADGMYVTNVTIEEKNFFFGKTVTVIARGKPITYKPLGTVSDARLNKITERIQDLRLTRMKTK